MKRFGLALIVAVTAFSLCTGSSWAASKGGYSGGGGRPGGGGYSGGSGYSKGGGYYKGSVYSGGSGYYRGSGYKGGGHYSGGRHYSGSGYYGGYHGGGHHHGGWNYGVVIGWPYWGWDYPYYPYPYYYPYYYPSTVVTVPSEPQEYIERTMPEERQAPAPPAVWYYCPDSKAYYPYVKECTSGWQTVPAQPPSKEER